MRSGLVKRGLIALILGLALAGFGWADIEYILTPLPYEINDTMITIGSVLALVGFIVLIYGLIKSPDAVPREPPATSPTRIRPSLRPQPRSARPAFCTYCGQPLNIDVNFCGHCGAPVT